MRNSFIVNITIVIVINLLIKPAYIFAVDIPVQNILGNEIYGLYFTFLNLAFIFQLVSDMGLQNLTYTELPRNRDKFQRLFSGIGSIRLVLGVCFMAIVCLAGGILGYWTQEPRLLLLVALNVFLISTLQYLRANVAGLGMYFKDSLLSVTDKLFILIVLVFLLYIRPLADFSIYTFVIVQTICLLVSISIGLIMLYPRLKWNMPTKTELKSYLVQGLPYGILAGLMFLYTRIDVIMIENMLEEGTKKAGLYASAYRLYDAASMFSFLFVTLLLPMFSDLMHRKERLDELYYGALQMILACSVILAWPLFFYRNEIMEILYTAFDASSQLTFGLLMLAFLWKSAVFIASVLLTAAKKLRMLCYISVVSIVFNITANLLVLPVYGITGAAFATILSQVVVAIGCIIYVHKFKLVELDLTKYLRTCISVLITLGLSFAMKNFMNLELVWALFVQVLVLSIVCLIYNKSMIAQLVGSLKRQ